MLLVQIFKILKKLANVISERVFDYDVNLFVSLYRSMYEGVMKLFVTTAPHYS